MQNGGADSKASFEEFLKDESRELYDSKAKSVSASARSLSRKKLKVKAKSPQNIIPTTNSSSIEEGNLGYKSVHFQEESSSER